MIDAGAVRCIIVSDGSRCSAGKTKCNARPLLFCQCQREASPGVDSRTVAVYKSLASRLAQSAETLRQRHTERAGNDYRVGLKSWLLVTLALAFAAANLVSAWFNNSAYDWMFYWLIIGIMLLVEGLFLWALFRAFRAQLMPPQTAADRR